MHGFLTKYYCWLALGKKKFVKFDCKNLRGNLVDIREIIYENKKAF